MVFLKEKNANNCYYNCILCKIHVTYIPHTTLAQHANLGLGGRLWELTDLGILHKEKLGQSYIRGQTQNSGLSRPSGNSVRD